MVVGTVRQIRALYAGVGTAGWATRGFTQAMTRVSMWGLAIWQVVALAALLIERVPPTAAAVLLTVHLGVVSMALAARSGRVPAWPVILIAYTAFLADWSLGASHNGPLLFAACWIANLASALPGLTVSGRRSTVTALVCIVLSPLIMLQTRPDLGPELPAAVLVTGLSILVVFWFGLASPLGFVDQADRQEAAAQERDRLMTAHASAVAKTAEDARVLHDTVINTMGAIANGGRAVADSAMVRRRCQQDIETVGELEAGRRRGDGPVVDLGAATRDLGVTVRHRGVTSGEFAEAVAAVPDTALAAQRVVVELVHNVAKHAGVNEVTIDTSLIDDGFRIVISDLGRGFDLDQVVSRGLSTSVAERGSVNDLTVDIDSAPGRGTRVTLTGRTSAPSELPTDAGPAVETVVSTLLRRAGMGYALGLAAVGVVLATSHPGGFNTDYLMVVTILLATAAMWLLDRHRPTPHVASVVIAAVASSIAFVFSAATSDFGRLHPYLWQCIAPVGPLNLLLSHQARTRELAATLAAYCATILGTLVIVNRADLFAAANVLVAGAVGLVLVIGWDAFQRSTIRIGRRAAEDQRRAAALDRELAAAAAAEGARRRWQEAGLDRSVALLETIVAGADPRSQKIRSACAAEESHLRQLTQLDPALIRMGPWFARALVLARESGAEFTVRTGTTGVSEDDATALGELTVEAVRATPAGQQITATLFPAQRQVCLTLVAGHDLLTDVLSRWRHADRYPHTLQHLAQRDIVEVTVRANIWGNPASTHGRDLT